MKLERFHITEFVNPSGATAYRVDGKDKDGKRVRRNFPTLGEARAEKQKLEAEIENIPAVPMLPTWLSPEQAREAEQAFKELEGRSLLKAVRYFNENYREAVNPIKVAEAYDRFLADKRKQNLREDSITNLRIKVAFLVRAHGEKLVSDILPEHIKEVVFTPERVPVASNNVRRAISGFFSWAVDSGFCKDNPVAKVPVAEVDEDEPEILTVAEARRLMAAAKEYKEGKLVPFVALALFCAMRPDKEMKRIGWDDIDIEHKTITVGGRVAKMRGRRVVDMEESAVEWLLPHAAKRTPLKGKNWRRDFAAVKKLAGFGTPTEKNPNLKPWVPDYMRHTAISFHLAKHQHEGKTAAWAGNSPDVIQKHYKGLVKSRKDVEAFWSIAPGEVGALPTPMPKAA